MMLGSFFRATKAVLPYSVSIAHSYEVLETVSTVTNSTSLTTVGLNLTQTIILNCAPPQIRFPVECSFLAVTLAMVCLQPGPITLEILAGATLQFYKNRYSV